MFLANSFDEGPTTAKRAPISCEGKDHVAILSHALWQSQFGANPSVIGRSIVLDGTPHTVIGILPGGGVFDRWYSQIWHPLAFERQNMTRNEEKAIVTTAPELADYVAGLKRRSRKLVTLAQRQLLRLVRVYPREPLLGAVREAVRYGLYDLDRLNG